MLSTLATASAEALARLPDLLVRFDFIDNFGYFDAYGFQGLRGKSVGLDGDHRACLCIK